MSTSTRESMRRELRELAKMAETMGKPSADAAFTEGNVPTEFPQTALERPVTPASASRVSVPPMATPTTPPVFDYAEPKRSGKHTGAIAVLIGAGLAIALVGGAAVGKSLAGSTTVSTPPVDVRGAAAAIAPPPVADPPVAAAAPAPPPAVDLAPAVPVKSPAPVAATPAAAPVHKHVAPKAAPAAAAPKPAAASNAAPPSGGDAVAAPKPAASPGLAKPTPTKAPAGGGSDSLEDLIRKEVAGQKK